MNAVGVLGRYISKGVYTVSGPFHPFGGAVDIVVVEQPDGSFKSSPWYVRFGKFQGVLKTKEKVVHVIVNGVEADLNMYLDAKGEAYFLREVDVEGESVSYPSSSGDETDGKLQQEQDGRGILSSKGSNYDTESSIVDIGVEKSEDSGKIAVSTSSRRSRILGFVWGRKSVKEDDYQDTSVARVGSLERAEIAANLLDVRWSTNIKPQKFGKEETSRFSSIDTSDGKDKNELKIDDGDNHVSSAVEGNMGNGPDNQMGDERCDNSSSEQIDNGHQYALKKLELSVEVTREMSNSNTKHHQAVETSIVEEKVFNETYEVKSEISREVIQVTLNDQDTENAMGIIPENTGSDSQISLLRDCDTYYEENFNGEHYSDETDIVSQGFSISEDKNISGGVQSLEFCGTSEISIMKVDDSRVQAHKTFADSGCGIVGIQVEQLHASMEVHSVDTVSTVVSADFEMETEEVEIIENYSQQINPYNTSIYDGNTIDQEEPVTCPDSFTEVVSTDPIPCSIKEVKSNSISSSFSSDLQDEEGVDGSVTSKCQNSLNSICNSVTINESRMIPPTNSDEEQFLFSDFDVLETKVIRNMESDSQHLDVEEDYPLVHPDGINEENRFVNRNVETCPSPDSHEIFKESTTSPITIPQSHPISNEEVEHLVASLPNMWTGIVGSPIACEIYHPLSCSVDSNPKSLKWMKLCKGDPSFKSGGDKEQVAEAQLKIEESQISEELNSILPDLVAGSPAESTVEPVGSWKPWPFTLQRSRSRKMTQSDIDGYSNFGTEKTLDRNLSNATDGAANIIKHKAERKMVRSISPTSEQLASLNLKEGGNTVTFTFSTSMLGKQQVDARIYLWKWDTRVVISDVDGTITKSDVLGQFMPFVGMDWSQTGVVHFFSAIKENGYQFLFLSARSISQAYTTRQFLFNLKQNGKALPEGPVVISPDGLFPSLYREVIRRAPHEFKIACLERIRDLFPPDCNPFYAGFGNRDTDEISYLKVGIPKGKIFIINPKGEVAVNRRIDTKSYTSLHTLVNRIFPSMTSSEQEDFNSWNYWKLSPFTVD